MTMALTIKADRNRCIGSEMCAAAAPGSFSLDTEGKVVVGEELNDPEASLRLAVASCPVGALSLEP
jgi:ferredoxin